MIVGHQQTQKLFQRLHETKHLPHAILLAGSAGIGKKLVAQELARSLFCEQAIYGGCQTCHNCRQLNAGNYPDLHQIDCADREQANAEAIRSIINTLAMQAFAGKGRVLIFDNAEYLSTTSSNILLKSLEEPRPGTYYFLIAANPTLIPITIRSRCQTYHLSDLSKQSIELIIQSNSIQIPKELPLAELLPFGSGSMVNIQKIINDLALWKDTQAMFESLDEHRIGKALEFVRNNYKDKEKLLTFLSFLQALLHYKMTSTTDQDAKLRYSIILNNLLLANYYITQRNLNANILLTAILSDFDSELTVEDLENYLI